MPLAVTRKAWERVFVLQALASRGCLRPGQRGLGFGVGADPMIPVMVKRGCALVATDYGDSEHRGWGAGLNLDPRNVAGAERMRDQVTQRDVDMNRIPPDLLGFDFTYSCGSLEHIGSLALGFEFVINAMDCLRPGGYAVHTTELNISGGTETLDQPGLGFYLPDTVGQLFDRLRAEGHQVAPLCMELGSTSDDLHIAQRPYDPPCLKVWHSGHQVTSMGFVIRANSRARTELSVSATADVARDISLDLARAVGRRLAAIDD